MYLDSIYENHIQTFSMVEKLRVYSRNCNLYNCSIQSLQKGGFRLVSLGYRLNKK